MNTAELLQRALQFDFLTKEEGVFLYHNAATADLAFVANELRKKQVAIVFNVLAGALKYIGKNMPIGINSKILPPILADALTK